MNTGKNHDAPAGGVSFARRLLLLALLLTSFFLATAYAQSTLPPQNRVFDDAVLPTIHIDIDPAFLDQILAPGNEQSDEEFPATFRIDYGTEQETVDSVGFRIRGNTSRVSAKKSFKISFNTFVRGRQFHGLEKLNINGEHNDPSIVRSKLSWDLFQQIGTPASRANHVRLYVNDEYKGLYVNVEHIDERFLRSRFGNDGGFLFKCLWPADLVYKGSDPDHYRYCERRLDGDDTEAYAALVHFLDVLNNTSDASFPDAIESVFNVNAFLRVRAITTLTGSWDDYWFLKNNFYLYYNPANRLFEFIPFDFDNTFGIWWNGILPGVDWGTRNVYDWGNPNEPRPLASRILNVPTYRDRYSFYLKRLLDDGFADLSGGRVDELHAVITEAAEADIYRTLDYSFTIADFHRSFDAPLTLPGQAHVTYGLKPYIQARRYSALGQIAAVDIRPIVSEPHHVPRQPLGGGSVNVVARVEDEDASPRVDLTYEVDGGTQQTITLHDDGVHGDRGTNDGWYGGAIQNLPAGASVRYRVVATDAGGRQGRSRWATFSVGAEGPSIFINELMASNIQTITDDAGEYDDWVELYNAGDAPVNLAGYFLTDDFGMPDRWTMPDTTIAPGGFLLVWADNDEEQGALHTSFRLDQAGEMVGLYSPMRAPVDTLRFGTRQSDRSFGRLPDGGSLVDFDVPTPGASNNGTGVGIAAPTRRAHGVLSAYPNPFRDRLAVDVVVAQPSELRIEVYNVLGRRVIDHRYADLAPGRHTVEVRSAGIGESVLPAGVYFLVGSIGSAGRSVRDAFPVVLVP